jgi:TonB family protein
MGDGPIKISMPSGPAGATYSGPAKDPINTKGEPGADRPDGRGEPNFTEFMTELQRKIKRAWFPPRDLASKRVKVMFKIHTDGQLSNLRISSSSGFAVADQAALNAVETAAPFRHLPEFAPENVDIEFTFDYNVFNSKNQ